MAGECHATSIFGGLSIYRYARSAYWYVRIRDTTNARYVVRSTKTTAKIDARRIALEHWKALKRTAPYFFLFA